MYVDRGSMKSVHVELDSGWAKEEWKIKRLFASSVKQLELADGDIEMSVVVGMHEKGYPEELRLSFQIPRDYMLQEGSGLVKFTSVQSSVFLPPGFVDKYLSHLNQQLLIQPIAPLRLFRTLQRADRSIAPLWIECVIEGFNAPEEPTVSGAVVNKINLPAIQAFQLHNMVADLCCLNCGQRIENHTFLGPLAALTCKGCESYLHVNVLRSLLVYGHKCAIAKMSYISGWTTSDATNSCTYMEFRDSGVLEILSSLPKTHNFVAPVHVRMYKPGSALPHNGACKHYKKSFRWIQYTCCSDWFPCNQCHEVKCLLDQDSNSLEMMCGYCSRQQPIGTACTGCGKELAPGWSAKERVSCEPPKHHRRKKRY